MAAVGSIAQARLCRLEESRRVVVVAGTRAGVALPFGYRLDVEEAEMEWNQEQERRSETKRGTGAGSVEHKYKVLPP